MEPSYEILGFKGGLRVWNNTHGYLDVSEEGHLLGGQTTAWVAETAKVISLIEEGLLLLVEGQISGDTQSSPSETPKKKKSSSPVAEVAPNSSDTENQVAVEDNKKETTKLNDTNNDVSVETV